MTLRELYALLGGRRSKGMMGRNQLLSRHEGLLARLDTTMGKGTIKVSVKVYESGYVLYEEDGMHTVFHLDDVCGKAWKYDGVADDGTVRRERTVSEEVFMSSEWSVRLILEGNERVMQNRDKREGCHVEFSYSGISDDIGQLGFVVDFLKEMENEIDREKRQKVIEKVKDALKPAQWKVFVLIECQGKKQREVAEEMGVSQQAVSKEYANARKVIEKLREGLRKAFYED